MHIHTASASVALKQNEEKTMWY